MNQVENQFINFMVCQKKTDDKSLILPEDINCLICQKLTDFIKHEQRDADLVEKKWYNRFSKWIKNDMLHREIDLPAYIVYDTCANCEIVKAWWQNGKLSRLNGPAFIEYHWSGIVKTEIYANDGVISKMSINRLDDTCSRNPKIVARLEFRDYPVTIDSFEKYQKLNVFVSDYNINVVCLS